MTRRLTISILLTLWAILLTGGAVAYLGTRAILFDDLDHALMSRALSQPQIERPANMALSPEVVPDRIIIHGPAPHTPPRTAPASQDPPRLLSARFAWADGRRLRTVTVAARTTAGDAVTIVCSGPTERVDGYLDRLMLILGGFTAATGLIVAALARYIARAALRPLTHAADTIGTINEKRLDRRIDAAALPDELRPMAERLNEMLARLEGAFSARRQFLADASHELRTPVAALVTSLEVSLLRPRDLEQYRQVLQQALADAQYLQQLSEGLLDAVRSEQPAPGHLEPLDLAALLNACCDLLAPLAEQRHVSLLRDIAPVGAIVTDGRRLRSVIHNLLGNAIEYNRPGGMAEISCRIETPHQLPPAVANHRATPGAIAAIVRVRDTGVGITPADLPRIFDPFFRVDAARTTHSQTPPESPAQRPVAAAHLGLGLALVKRHVESLGGALHVESTPDSGTAFTIVLDAPCPAENSWPAAQVAASD